MADFKSDIEILLDSLDKSVNSNTAWLNFSINSSNYFDLNKYLVNQLKTGYFHMSLVENDISRGWENYISLTLSKNFKDSLIPIQRPGNTWNGNENLDIKEITIAETEDYLTDLLIGGQKYFSKSALGTTVDIVNAKSIFTNFIKYLTGKQNKKLKFYKIEPNFLTTIEEYYQSDCTKIGYFENSGRDFVLGILLYNEEMETSELNILMTNGYS